MNKKYILLLNGPFASGKSTTAELVACMKDNIAVIDWDDINSWLYIKNIDSKKSLRFEILMNAVKTSSHAGYSVIVPNTICDDKKINNLKLLANEENAIFIHVVLMCDIKTSEERILSRNRNDSITDESLKRTLSELNKISSKNNVHKIEAGNKSPQVIADEVEAILQQNK